MTVRPIGHFVYAEKVAVGSVHTLLASHHPNARFVGGLYGPAAYTPDLNRVSAHHPVGEFDLDRLCLGSHSFTRHGRTPDLLS